MDINLTWQHVWFCSFIFCATGGPLICLGAAIVAWEIVTGWPNRKGAR